MNFSNRETFRPVSRSESAIEFKRGDNVSALVRGKRVAATVISSGIFSEDMARVRYVGEDGGLKLIDVPLNDLSKIIIEHPIEAAIGEISPNTNTSESEDIAGVGTQAAVDKLKESIAPITLEEPGLETVLAEESTLVASPEDSVRDVLEPKEVILEVPTETIDFSNEQIRQDYFSEVENQVSEILAETNSKFAPDSLYYNAVLFEKRTKTAKFILENVFRGFETNFQALEQAIATGEDRTSIEGKLGVARTEIEIQAGLLRQAAAELDAPIPFAPEIVTVDSYEEAKRELENRLHHIIEQIVGHGFDPNQSQEFRDLKAQSGVIDSETSLVGLPPEVLGAQLERRYEKLKELFALAKVVEEGLMESIAKETAETAAADVLPAEASQGLSPADSEVLPESEAVAEPRLSKLVLTEADRIDRADTAALKLETDGLESRDAGPSTIEVEPEAPRESHRTTLEEMSDTPFTEDELLNSVLYNRNVRPYVLSALNTAGVSLDEAEKLVSKSLDKIINEIDSLKTAPAQIATRVNQVIQNFRVQFLDTAEKNDLTSVTPEVLDLVETGPIAPEQSEAELTHETLLDDIYERISDLETKYDAEAGGVLFEPLYAIRKALVQYHESDPSPLKNGLLKYQRKFDETFTQATERLSAIAGVTSVEKPVAPEEPSLVPVEISELKADDVVLIGGDDGHIKEVEVEIVWPESNRVTVSWLENGTRINKNLPIEQIQKRASDPSLPQNEKPIALAEGPGLVESLPEYDALGVLVSIEHLKKSDSKRYATAFSMYENYQDLVSGKGITQNPSAEQVTQAYENLENFTNNMLGDTEQSYLESQSEKIAAKESYRTAEAAYQDALRDFYAEHKGKSVPLDGEALAAYETFTAARVNYFTIIKESVVARRKTLTLEQQDFLTEDRIIRSEARLNAMAANQLVIEAAKERNEIQKEVLAAQSAETNRIVETAKRIGGWFKRNKTAIRAVSFTVTVSVAMVVAAPLGIATAVGAGAIAGTGWGARLYTGALGGLFGAAAASAAAKTMTERGIARQEKAIETDTEEIKITFTEKSIEDFDTALTAQLEKLQTKERRQGKIITGAAIAGAITGGVLAGRGIVNALTEDIAETMVSPSGLTPGGNETVVSPDSPATERPVSPATDAEVPPVVQSEAPAQPVSPNTFYGVELNEPAMPVQTPDKIYSDHATPPSLGAVPGVEMPVTPPETMVPIPTQSLTTTPEHSLVSERLLAEFQAGTLKNVPSGLSEQEFLVRMNQALVTLNDHPEIVVERLNVSSGDLNLIPPDATFDAGPIVSLMNGMSLENIEAGSYDASVLNESLSPIVESASQANVVTVETGSRLFSLVDSIIEPHLSGIPEFEQQALTADVKAMLFDLSPEEVKAMGIKSGNISLLQPGERIDFKNVIDFVNEKTDARWAPTPTEVAPAEALLDTESPASVEAQTMTPEVAAIERSPVVITEEVVSQYQASYPGGEGAFQHDLNQYVTSVQGPDPKGGWMSAMFAPDAGKANAYEAMKNARVSELQEANQWSPKDRLALLREKNIRVADFDAWMSHIDKLQATGLIKSWGNLTLENTIVRGFIAGKLNGTMA